jgi:Rab GDP dissociation inhibitor
MTMDQLYEKFGLAEDTIEFIGHAVALYPNVAYRKRPALASVKRMQLYYQSLTRFAGLKSPYIYPLYGLGELPQVCHLALPRWYSDRTILKQDAQGGL